MKKGAVLLEVLISIALFGIIVVFFQQSFYLIQNTNNHFAQETLCINNLSKLKQNIFLDLLKSDQIKITTTKQQNSCLNITTTNYYHNPFYHHIAYLLLPNHKLIRIESKKMLDIENIDDNFLENSYIDIVLDDIVKFKVTKMVLYNHTKSEFMIEDISHKIYYIGY